MSDEALVVELHTPRWAKLLFPLFLGAAPVACIVWIGLAPSWQAIVYGGLLIASCVLVAGMIRASRRAAGSGPKQIVVTAEGISTQMWSLPWSRVARIWIGFTPWPARVRVLNIEPFDSGDVRRPRSLAYAVNAKLVQQMGVAPIQIPEANIDRPLEELLAQLEEKWRASVHREQT